MKTMKNLMIAVALFMGATTFTNAQSKTAHVDTQALVESMPEMREGQSQLEKLQKTYDTAIKDMTKEFQAKVTQFSAEFDAFPLNSNGTISAEANAFGAAKQKEVQGMERNISAYREQALKDLQKKEVDVYQPILEKARAAIQKVARAKGYQYVLDSATGNGVILADGFDLLMDVKKELGI